MSALLSIADCADLAGVSDKTLRRDIHDGKLTVTRIRGRIKIAPSDWEAYLQKCRSAVTVQAGKPAFSTMGVGLEKLLGLDVMPFRGKRSSGAGSTIVNLAERRASRSKFYFLPAIAPAMCGVMRSTDLPIT